MRTVDLDRSALNLVVRQSKLSARTPPTDSTQRTPSGSVAAGCTILKGQAAPTDPLARYLLHFTDGESVNHGWPAAVLWNGDSASGSVTGHERPIGPARGGGTGTTYIR